MGLFSRSKKSAQQNKKLNKYLVNVRDKKYRKYLDERFDRIITKEDVAQIMEELQWASTKSKIESMPRRKRIRMLKYMAKHISQLAPDVKHNFIRYMVERYGVSFEK
jgi:hypothetical protein